MPPPGTSRFRFRISGAFRWLFRIFGVTPATAWIDVSEDALAIRYGWGGVETVARADVQAARRIGWPFWHGLGWRFYGIDRLALVAAGTGAVEIALKRRLVLRFLGLRVWPARWIAVSLVEPDQFLAALGVPARPYEPGHEPAAGDTRSRVVRPLARMDSNPRPRRG
jgi:hypothetical protein